MDAASKQINTSTVLRRHACLRSASIPEDTRVRIEDLPFDSLDVFDGKTEEILDNLQKMRRQQGHTTLRAITAWQRSCTYQPSHPQSDRFRPSMPSTSYSSCQQLGCQHLRQPYHQPEKKQKGCNRIPSTHSQRPKFLLLYPRRMKAFITF